MPKIIWAEELYELHKNARALGMGNAFVSMVDGDEALFYNPAGLARNGGFYWTIIDPAAGINTLDSADIDNFMDLTSDVTSEFNAALNGLYGENIWAGLNTKTALVSPFVTVAFYADADISFRIDNPPAPSIMANYIYDTGIALGSGFSFGPLEVGAVAKRIVRTGNRQLFGPGDVASIVGGGANTISDIMDVEGIGYSFDFGMSLVGPSPFTPTVSFVWKNVGDTSFRTGVGQTEPPKDEQEFIVGASMVFDAWAASVTPSIDIKHIDNHDAQIGKKIHLGAEVSLPLLDLRAGYHQGYLSYGAGVNLGFMQLDAASWGVELGEYPGQLEDRRYMLQATIQLGFDFGLSGSARSGGGGSSSSESSTASRNGFGGSSSGTKSRWRRGNKSRR